MCQVKSYGVLFAEMLRLYPDSIQVILLTVGT